METTQNRSTAWLWLALAALCFTVAFLAVSRIGRGTAGGDEQMITFVQFCIFAIVCGVCFGVAFIVPFLLWERRNRRKESTYRPGHNRR